MIFLYKSFIEKEYDYLRDRRVDEEENIFAFHFGLPYFPLPFCVKWTSNKLSKWLHRHTNR